MKKVALYPMKFRPILKSMIWGGEQIIPFKGLCSSQQKVGESWELSGVEGSESVVAEGELAGLTITELLTKYKSRLIGEANYKRFGNEFPLLVKFIDAEDDLSIQVHPNDELAAERHNSKGKTEMWYVFDAKPGAKLRSGFAQEVTPAEYVESVENNSVTDILKEYSVERGDLFFLPAGRIHSIGAGCFIAEIQQTSNITYRIYDFNRTDAEGKPRELHTEQAKDAIDYKVEADYRTHYDRTTRGEAIEVVKCPYFTTSILELAEDKAIDYSALDSFVIYICVEDRAVVNGIAMDCGETLLLPATTTEAVIKTTGCKLLTTCIC
ncbi:MAG: type I phosphomannose isomerase catalytic subunit [Rikenellaceae bacterium]